jgi:ABC-type nickel/cobalt efflux system permease component RcnA
MFQLKNLTFNGTVTNVTEVSIRAAIEALLQTVLTLSIVVVYGVGSVAAVEFEHDHGDSHSVESTEAPNEHHHDHDGHHHHDDHNGDEDDKGGETPDDEGNSTSHHHSHIVSFDTQVATNLVNLLPIGALGFSIERLAPEKDLCPDGPFYELSKPPQLG